MAPPVAQAKIPDNGSMLFDLLPHGHGEVGECAVFDPNSSWIAVSDPEFHQLARFCDGEGAQSHRVQDLEDGSVSPDAERERGDDDEGKVWTSEEDSQGSAHIVPEAFQPDRSVLRGDPLAHGSGTAEASARIALGLFAAHTLSHVVVDAHSHVFPQLGLDLLLDAPTLAQRKNSPEKCHRSPHANRSTASTPLTTCTQFFSRLAS
jgi:hypothetical protein